MGTCQKGTGRNSRVSPYKVMKKRTIIFLSTLLITILIILAIKDNGYIISRAMLSRSSGFMRHAVNRIIIRQIPSDKRDIATELEFINRYIYLNLRPYGKVRDDGASWMLIYGEAWCDSVANIFIRLIGPLNIRGYLVFLRSPDGVSPHSVAYCTPGDLSIRDVEYLQRKAVVVDPQNGVIYRTGKNIFASPAQICNGLANIPESLSNHRQYYCERPTIFLHNRPISTQPSFKRWFYRNIFPRIPESWLKWYIRILLVLNNKFEKAERMYYLARVEQLFLNYSGAIESYTKVVDRYPDTRWKELASYWRDIISSPQNRFP